MISHLANFLWSTFYPISLFLHFLKLVSTISNIISMARSTTSNSSSSISTCIPPFTWSCFRSLVCTSKGYGAEDLRVDNSPPLSVPVGSDPQPESCTQQYCLQENLCGATSWGLHNQEHPRDSFSLEGCPEENHLRKEEVFTRKEFSGERKEGLMSSSLGVEKKRVLPCKVRKRPAKIVIPETHDQVLLGLDIDEVMRRSELQAGEKEVIHVLQGSSFWLVSKKGSRKVMEDGYSVITDISGDSRQAFFGVFDGHGGRAAVDHVTKKLGNNILRAIEKTDHKVEEEDNILEQAIKAGYLTTDKEFLSQGESSGACVATVLLKNEELHVANLGDCRVVLSRSGAAIALTSDHRAERQDERLRIESEGGFVHCNNGVWRVQGSLAVSRAIGDAHLKEWIISEPETIKLSLSSDCEFLIVASDGLWDKVTNQEAVDTVLRHKSSMECCKMLVDISSCRGNKDDITVMVVDLQNFRQICG